MSRTLEVEWKVGQIWKSSPGFFNLVVEVSQEGIAKIQMIDPFVPRALTQKDVPENWVLLCSNEVDDLSLRGSTWKVAAQFYWHKEFSTRGLAFVVSNDGGETVVAWRENVHAALDYQALQNRGGLNTYAVVVVPNVRVLSPLVP